MIGRGQDFSELFSQKAAVSVLIIPTVCGQILEIFICQFEERL
jgi:hypothetical protein